MRIKFTIVLKSLSENPIFVTVFLLTDSNNECFIIEDNPAIVDLALLSCFKNHIIANSSFSWWGAWLANGDTVVAPRNWFTCDYNTKDLIPDRWIRV